MQPLCNSTLTIDCSNFEVQRGGIVFGVLKNLDKDDTIPHFFERMNSVPGPSMNQIPPAAYGMFSKVDSKGLVNSKQLIDFLEMMVGVNAILVTSFDPIEGYDKVSQDGIEAFADIVAKYNKRGVPVFIRPAHEMNGPWYIYGMQPRKYKDFYVNVFNTVKKKAPFAKFIFAPMTGNAGGGYPWDGYALDNLTPDNLHAMDTNNNGRVDVGDDPYSPYYPGDQFVDWFGVSAYWKGDWPYTVNQKCDAEYFTDLITQGTYSAYGFAETHLKPMMITEMAGSYCAENPGVSDLEVKQPFWRDVFGDASRSRLPLLKMAMWFDYNKFEDGKFFAESEILGAQRDFSISDNTGPNGGSLQQVASAFKQDLANMTSVFYSSNLGLSTSENCGCFRYDSSESALDGVVNTFTPIYTSPEPIFTSVYPSPPPKLLNDWNFCTNSTQCKNACCSKEFSDDGKYKCTPGGTHCNDIIDLNQTTTVIIPTASPGIIGDWNFCQLSSECVSNCCSNEYSDDGKFKCTPGGSKCRNDLNGTTTIQPTSTPIGTIGDWSFCTISTQCRNGCCSNEYSDDGKFKCTPGGSHCLKDVNGTTTIQPTSTSTPIGTIGDWYSCTISSECKNGCCSNEYSDDGKFKCTPGGSHCLSDSNSTSTLNFPLTTTTTDGSTIIQSTAVVSSATVPITVRDTTSTSPKSTTTTLKSTSTTVTLTVSSPGKFTQTTVSTASKNITIQPKSTNKSELPKKTKMSTTTTSKAVQQSSMTFKFPSSSPNASTKFLTTTKTTSQVTFSNIKTTSRIVTKTTTTISKFSTINVKSSTSPFKSSTTTSTVNTRSSPVLTTAIRTGNSTNLTRTATTTKVSTPTNLADWEICSTSSQCACRCCSKTFYGILMPSKRCVGHGSGIKCE
ncbi:hypothetical protein HK098_005256 [Nowakowskiella sp. JEL0407]|nr:hypothetical protein HK098_005256 [Nowakowskiella sp. JEL0407]